MLEEGWAEGIKDIVDSAKKKFSINFTKGKTKFCSSLDFSTENSYLPVNVK